MEGGGGVFFFPAEDGIRDYDVTGVQTCALPIYSLAGVIMVDLDDRLGAFEDVEAERVRVESGVENLQKEGVELVVFNIPRDCRVEVTGPGRIRNRYVVVIVPDRDIRWLEDFELLQVESQNVLMDDSLNTIDIRLGYRSNLDSIRCAGQLIGRGYRQNGIEDVTT